MWAGLGTVLFTNAACFTHLKRHWEKAAPGPGYNVGRARARQGPQPLELQLGPQLTDLRHGSTRWGICSWKWSRTRSLDTGKQTRPGDSPRCSWGDPFNIK